MSIDQESILSQINQVLERCEKVQPQSEFEEIPLTELSELNTLLITTIDRLAPPRSSYYNNAHEHTSKLIFTNPDRVFNGLFGILKALKTGYEAGYLKEIHELIHADIFADFLEMAKYLLKEGYKDPAAVIAGGVLEEHLRKLCQKNEIDVMHNDRPKKVETLNAELKKAMVYETLDQKNVTAWYDLRTKAAHGKYKEYNKEQVDLMVQSIRDFITRHPA